GAVASIAKVSRDHALGAHHSPGFAAAAQVAHAVARGRAHLGTGGHELGPRTPGRRLQHGFPGLEHRRIARATRATTALADARRFPDRARDGQGAGEHQGRQDETLEVAHSPPLPPKTKRQRAWDIARDRCRCTRVGPALFRGKPWIVGLPWLAGDATPGSVACGAASARRLQVYGLGSLAALVR